MTRTRQSLGEAKNGRRVPRLHPLFIPEATVANEVVALMRAQPLTREAIEAVWRLMVDIDRIAHYDGTGWYGFRGAVDAWLSLNGYRALPTPGTAPGWSTPPRARMARRRVLLVGGDPQVTAVLSEHLRRGDSYEIESFDYCDDALMVLQRQPFDLVLVLSFNAPWRTWPSLRSPARRIGSASAILFLKQMRVLPSPPRVIVVSALALMSPQAKEEALANGAFALLPKPVILAELDRLVLRALEAEAGDR